MTVRRLLMVGWDGAEPSLIESMLARGLLPVLASLKARGAYGGLHSTWPPSSLPAWTSALTGVSPGRHGMVDFVAKARGRYCLELVSAARREFPTFLQRAHEAGQRVTSLGIPGTYPPDANAGSAIAGFDSPVATRAGKQACHPESLYTDLRRAGLDWPYGEADELSVGQNWHQAARQSLFRTIDRKLQVAEFLLKRDEHDLFFIVFSESDTVAHHFWAFCDPQSPRSSGAQPSLANTIEETYCALDQALGRLLAFTQADTSVMIFSDHGAGGSSDHVAYLNRWLAAEGFLRFHPLYGPLSMLAGRFRDQAAKYLPPAVKQALLRGPWSRLVMAGDGLGRFGGIDFAGTQAFSDELPQNPGIWLNLAGRELRGQVAEEQYQALCAALGEKLLAWHDPLSGRPVVKRVRTRAKDLPGPYSDRAPDLMLELSSWDGYRVLAAPSEGRTAPLLRRLPPNECLGAKGTGTSGVHKSQGILLAAGPKVEQAASLDAAHLVDICPTAMALLGLPLVPDLDGRCLDKIAGPVAPAEPDAVSLPSTTHPVYSKEEERLVAKRLQDLGYL